MMEFESSGLRQNEFCRKHGLALSTLQRRLKKRRLDQGEAKGSLGWLQWSWPARAGVEITGHSAL